jgi:transglutaminase/protease-like cytokinesis protein 3
MVRINGEWYCVDVAWDDPVDSAHTPSRDYFNATSDFLRGSDHQWDESTVPEATDMTYMYIDTY